MGWLFGWNTRKQLIDHLVDGNGVHTLKHCCVGNVMWAVQEGTSLRTGETVRFIACYLLKGRNTSRDGWGYKDMEESMHPYYYTCPLSYLDMVDPTCPEWRAKVRERAASRGLKLTAGDVVIYCDHDRYRVVEKVSAGKYKVMLDRHDTPWLPTYVMTTRHLANCRLVPRTVIETARPR
jgi:hypothetical protein